MGQKAVLEAAVVAISSSPQAGLIIDAFIRTFAMSFLCITSSIAAVLPEERADALYHSYDGGGVTIDGPSFLVRKNFNDKYSIKANYYVDMVSSASIDVVANASKYEEERTEYSLGFDYLNERTIMSFSFSNSSENDYTADTFGFTVSQDFFGDLSTLTMGYSQGDDTVTATGSEEFEDYAERRRYSLGFSQVLSRKLLVSFSYESVIDEGFLRNPYRQARRLPLPSETGGDFFFIAGDDQALYCGKDGSVAQGGECYPETRNSEAYALRGIYSLTTLSSLRAEYRVFEDSWGVESSNYELRYAHQIGNRWLLEARYRYYDQSKGADFYQDIFDFTVNTPRYYARDKELSEYTSDQIGIGVTYTFKSHNDFFNNSTLTFQWDTMEFNYANFRDVTAGGTAGEEPLYSLEADVVRIFFSTYL